MLNPMQLKDLVDACLTGDGISYKRQHDKHWTAFNPANCPIQIGAAGYDWIKSINAPPTQNKGQTIGQIGNADGSLYLAKQDNGAWQWGISNYDDNIDFETIPAYLAEALLRYENERGK
jgi:hypothetical protein